MTKSEIITDFNRYIENHGGPTATYGWYVGITAKPAQRLVDEHKVNETTDAWIYRKANSASIARAVEKAYLDVGYKGGGGGGDNRSAYVYAYRITLFTSEDG